LGRKINVRYTQRRKSHVIYNGVNTVKTPNRLMLCRQLVYVYFRIYETHKYTVTAKCRFLILEHMRLRVATGLLELI